MRFVWAAWALFATLLAGCGTDPSVDPDPPGGVQESANRAPSQGRARIIFFGDSITAGGVYPNGYVSIFDRTIRYLYPNYDIEVIGSGVEGNRVTDLLKRLDRDVLSKEPTHVVVYVGVNDVGSSPPPGGNTGVVAYRRGLGELVSRIQGAGAEAIVCTTGVIGENVTKATDENRLLDTYAQVAREVAASSGSRVCDLRAAFTGYLKRFNPDGLREGVLTVDGIHLNDSGNRFVARQILNTFSTMFESKSRDSG